MNQMTLPLPPLPAAATPRRRTVKSIIAAGESDLLRLRYFMPGFQLRCVRDLIRTSEEREYFADKMKKIADRVDAMPATYATEKMTERVAWLHYFVGGTDCYILEKDIGDPEDPEPGQHQAYGWIRHGHMPECAGFGYISLPEIFEARAELDFDFTPTPIAEIIAKFEA